jgi:hypothetical protein
MRKTLAAIIILFSVLGASRAAELRSTVGTVEVKKAGSAVWSQGRPKTAVKDGDVVRTGVGSETEIRMDEGHKLTLKEKTTLKVDSGRSPDTRFDLLVGRVRSFVSKLKRQNKFEIKTPVAVASIRGTVFELSVDEQGASRLSVLEGIVSYRDLAGLGQEVQVLKGQSVVIEPGAAPRPAEPLPQELREGLVPDGQQQSATFALKAEVQRESGLQSFKEFFQTDAALEMKNAQYQEGKTLTDAFGKRVRLEEYIARPAANQWSFVSLNTREDRFDFTRFDLYAKNALPEDISTVNLFSGSGHDSMGNWVEKTHRLSSNSGDYYREWQDGGAPVNMTDSSGNKSQRVVFSDWYAEVKAEGSAPTLLTHWVPDAGFSGGNPTVTKSRDDADAQSDGLADIPSGYINFESGSDAGSAVGDTRGIDAAGFSNTQRLDAFDNAGVRASYDASEGYARTSGALFDGRTFQAATLAQILTAKAVSRLSTYDVPGTASDITLQVDQYYFTDEGTDLNFLQAAQLGSNVQGVNFETVFNSSLTGNRKIDVVISPSILKKAGLLDN